MDASPPLLDLESVTVTYSGGHQAVNSVSFSLQKGEKVGLVGESGSGKSTLARAILGLVHPSSGMVTLHGTSVAEMSRKQRVRAVQMVFQDPYHSLNPRRTVRQTLVEALAAAGRSTEKDAGEAAVDLLHKVQLDANALDRFPHQFSGGQRQRICIARALAPRPELLVCDEAVSALDVTTQRSIIELLSHLSQKENITLLFITHDIPLVEDLCERVLILDRGTVIEEGSTEAVFKNPRTKIAKKLLDSVLRI